jgi:hypothetical protein
MLYRDNSMLDFDNIVKKKFYTNETLTTGTIKPA